MTVSHVSSAGTPTVEPRNYARRGAEDDFGVEDREVDRASERRLLLRVEDVAEMLGLGRTRVHDLIRTGTLGSVKIGGSRRVLVAEVHRYVEGLTKTTG